MKLRQFDGKTIQFFQFPGMELMRSLVYVLKKLTK